MKAQQGMNRFTVTLDPAAPSIWQVQTGWIFAWLAARDAYRYERFPQRLFHTSSFDRTPYLARLHLVERSAWEDARGGMGEAESGVVGAGGYAATNPRLMRLRRAG